MIWRGGMLRQIEARFGQRITVNELARALDVTPRALNYAARSVFGMSSLDLTQAFRLNHVRNELWGSACPKPALRQRR